MRHGGLALGPEPAEDPGGNGAAPQRRPGEPVPVSIESFHLTKARATAERYTDIDPAVEP